MFLFGIIANLQKSYKNSTKNTPYTIYLDSLIYEHFVHLIIYLSPLFFSLSIYLCVCVCVCVCVAIFEGHTYTMLFLLK